MRALPFIGIVLFGGAVFITIFFAEGYQYDFQKKDIVKKGVIYFEGSFKDVEVVIDGQLQKAQNPFHGEVRVSPGPHDMEIRKKGWNTWKKYIIVPEDKVVNFAQIWLLPQNLEQFTTAIPEDKVSNLQSWSELGIFLVNSKLHFGKYYFLKPGGKFWVKDLPIKSAFSKLTPLSEDNFVGIASKNRFFTYDAEDGKEIFAKNISAVDLKVAGDKTLVLDKAGKVFDVTDGALTSKLFLSLPSIANSFLRVQNIGNYFAFLISLKNENIFIVAGDSGEIIFQEGGVDGSYIEKDKAYYTKNKQLIVFDLKEKKEISRRDINTDVKWLSRIGDSFNFLFLTKDRNLLYCDEDFDNCNHFAKLDSFFIEASENRSVFIARIKDKFTLLDFAEESFFPQFLEDLISSIL
ncbi:MAG: hypothetical protein AAB739_04965 [Patescibacteria group bacterium]